MPPSPLRGEGLRAGLGPLRANRNISRRAGEGTRPYEIRGTLRPFRRGRTLAGPQVAFGRAPHPPPSGAPSPKGEGFRATTRVAPTVGNEPGALARKRQARERNRTSPNFPPTQAPSGAGRDRTQALLILRAGNVLPTSRDNPRNGVRGKRSYGPRRSEAEP